jgi:hypothetical protein
VKWSKTLKAEHAVRLKELEEKRKKEEAAREREERRKQKEEEEANKRDILGIIILCI